MIRLPFGPIISCRKEVNNRNCSIVVFIVVYEMNFINVPYVLLHNSACSENSLWHIVISMREQVFPPSLLLLLIITLNQTLCSAYSLRPQASRGANVLSAAGYLITITIIFRRHLQREMKPYKHSSFSIYFYNNKHENTYIVTILRRLLWLSLAYMYTDVT